MANTIRKLFTIGFGSISSSVIQSREINNSTNPLDLANWTLFEKNYKDIYRIGTFDFRTSYSIKQHEETCNILDKHQTLLLLSNISIKKYLERGYNYIHIGLVQIVVKPLYRRGIDSPVFLALRDATNSGYEHLLLAIV